MSNPAKRKSVMLDYDVYAALQRVYLTGNADSSDHDLIRSWLKNKGDADYRRMMYSIELKNKKQFPCS